DKMLFHRRRSLVLTCMRSERDLSSIPSRPPRLICWKSLYLPSVPPDPSWVTGLKHRVVAVPHPFLASNVDLADFWIGDDRKILTAPNAQPRNIRKSQTIEAGIPHDANTGELLF